jgi:hypothetical protein
MISQTTEVFESLWRSVAARWTDNGGTERPTPSIRSAARNGQRERAARTK